MTEIPSEAQRLPQEARAVGGRGDYQTALRLLNQAHALAPSWPYPLYDAAFTYLMQGDVAQAEALYAMVDELAPRGFFTTKVSLDVIRRERAGALPEGFSKAFAMLEWTEPEEKRRILTGIVERHPDFAPAWKEIYFLLDDPDAKLDAVARGLAGRPDPQTKGLLRLNQAMLLTKLGRGDEAQEILRDLVADPASTLEVEAFAKQLVRA